MKPQIGSLFICCALLLSAAVFFQAAPAHAQSRLSDKDVEQRMKNLTSDAKKFRSDFNTAVGKSSIRKTSQEKDAKKLAQTFENQTKQMLDVFKKSRKSDPYLQNCLDSAQQIDRVMQTAQLTGMTLTQWNRVKAELGDLADAFHMTRH